MAIVKLALLPCVNTSFTLLTENEMTLENCIILERQIQWRKTYRISKIENVRNAGGNRVKILTQHTELKQAHISLRKTEQLLDRYGQSVSVI